MKKSIISKFLLGNFLALMLPFSCPAHAEEKNPNNNLPSWALSKVLIFLPSDILENFRVLNRNANKVVSTYKANCESTFCNTIENEIKQIKAEFPEIKELVIDECTINEFYKYIFQNKSKKIIESNANEIKQLMNNNGIENFVIQNPVLSKESVNSLRKLNARGVKICIERLECDSSAEPSEEIKSLVAKLLKLKGKDKTRDDKQTRIRSVRFCCKSPENFTQNLVSYMEMFETCGIKIRPNILIDLSQATLSSPNLKDKLYLKDKINIDLMNKLSYIHYQYPGKKFWEILFKRENSTTCKAPEIKDEKNNFQELQKNVERETLTFEPTEFESHLFENLIKLTDTGDLKKTEEIISSVDRIKINIPSNYQCFRGDFNILDANELMSTLLPMDLYGYVLRLYPNLCSVDFCTSDKTLIMISQNSNTDGIIGLLTEVAVKKCENMYCGCKELELNIDNLGISIHNDSSDEVIKYFQVANCFESIDNFYLNLSYYNQTDECMKSFIETLKNFLNWNRAKSIKILLPYDSLYRSKLEPDFKNLIGSYPRSNISFYRLDETNNTLHEDTSWN